MEEQCIWKLAYIRPISVLQLITNDGTDRKRNNKNEEEMSKQQTEKYESKLITDTRQKFRKVPPLVETVLYESKMITDLPTVTHPA